MKFSFSLPSLRLCTLAAAAILACSMAHATPVGPVTTIQITGDSPEFTGTLYEDMDDNIYGSLSYFDGTNTYTFDGTDLIGIQPTTDYFILGFGDASSDVLYLGYSTVDPITMTDTFLSTYLCSTAHPCGTDSFVSYVAPSAGGQLNVSDGILNVTQPATTPEPSSLALLGTGVLGVAGAARRRFRRG